MQLQSAEAAFRHLSKIERKAVIDVRLSIARVIFVSAVWKIIETLSNRVNEVMIWKKSTLNIEYNPSIYQFGELFPNTEITKNIKLNKIGKLM